jgi:hypothetical protein
VEGCIAEAFYLKEISHYTSTYFAEENNINAHIPRYHTSNETPMSNLKLFQWTGKAAGSSTMICRRRWKNILCKYHDIYLICQSRLAICAK